MSAAIASERPVPLLFVGVGEDIDDLPPPDVLAQWSKLDLTPESFLNSTRRRGVFSSTVNTFPQLLGNPRLVRKTSCKKGLISLHAFLPSSL
jgi:hypothetical protein